MLIPCTSDRSLINSELIFVSRNIENSFKGTEAGFYELPEIVEIPNPQSPILS